jgi:hypothetical protein
MLPARVLKACAIPDASESDLVLPLPTDPRPRSASCGIETGRAFDSRRSPNARSGAFYDAPGDDPVLEVAAQEADVPADLELRCSSGSSGTSLAEAPATCAMQAASVARSVWSGQEGGSWREGLLEVAPEVAGMFAADAEP